MQNTDTSAKFLAFSKSVFRIVLVRAIIMKDLRKNMRAIKTIKKNAGIKIKIKIFKREVHRNILYFFSYYLYNCYM